MIGLRYADVEYRDNECMDLTSLTQDEFAEVLPTFEAAFQERMQTYRLDGHQRTGRGYVTYDNCLLPTPEDRLLFILVYLKTNPLQTVHGRMFGMPQNKANRWIHTLLPVLQVALRRSGDAPARTLYLTSTLHYKPRHAWWPVAIFDDFGHCHYDRESTNCPGEPYLVSNSISSARLHHQIWRRATMLDVCGWAALMAATFDQSFYCLRAFSRKVSRCGHASTLAAASRLRLPPRAVVRPIVGI